jgi:hypothetical protein|eukprot:COSAG01_NODE_1190_length_11321_cov_15.842809_13_plen_284_part_00
MHRAMAPHLLSDRQMREFISSGYLVMQLSELSATFHDAVWEQVKEHFGPDNNGLRGTSGAMERIPDLRAVISTAALTGALTSLLGAGYTSGHLGDGRCALHISGSEDQIFHKDTQRAVVTGGRTRACMVMYYPGGADESMGPTAIVPSSHLLSRDGLGSSLGVLADGPANEANREDWSGVQQPTSLDPHLAEHRVVVPTHAGGTVCIVHEDMCHRATPASPGAKWRPMLKWSFTRLCAPAPATAAAAAAGRPSWAHEPASAAAGARRPLGVYLPAHLILCVCC